MPESKDVRERYLEEYNSILGRHADRAFDYEKAAIEFAAHVLRALT